MNEETEAALMHAGFQLERLQRENEVLRQEHARQRAQYDGAVKILTGIHALLYPRPIATPDGKTYVFRPQGIDPHELLQELSDRIRAVPDGLMALATTPPHSEDHAAPAPKS